MQLKSQNYTLLSKSELESDDARTRQRRWSVRGALKWAVLSCIGAGLIIALNVVCTRNPAASFPDIGSRDACPQYPALQSLSEARTDLERDLTQALRGDAFLNASLGRLQGAIRIPTESFDDMGRVGEDPRWNVFADFHAYLERTFPLVFTKLDVAKVNTYGIVITWEGSDDSLKPFLFMAHQDVVPVPDATVSRWTYDPWSAHYDGRFVWGRGSSDCKNDMIGVLEAFEVLLEKGFTPKRTMLTGFGFDEEISGWRGAQHIAHHLEEKLGKNSIELIIDEGGLGIIDLYGATFALPSLGEKGGLLGPMLTLWHAYMIAGYLDVRITIETAGGHSSVPPDHTGIGILSQIISAIESKPYSPELTPKNPFYTTLQCMAEYGTEMDSWLRKTIKKALHSKDAAQEVADYLADTDVIQRYLLQTSQAVDLVNGGVKVNALPEKVYAVVNHRVAVESTVDDIREHLSQLLHDQILSKFDLSLDAWGQVSGNTSNSAVGKIILEDFEDPLEPSPVTPLTTDAFRMFAGTIKQVLGEDVIVAPSLMTGNTDTKFYWDLSENIYRFSPTRNGGAVNAHTVDERVGMREHVEGVRFYAQIILNGDES
ncbi:MAG: hypothetical protein M1818_002667 [Claussenomyces sp. TS43310]|nr:MAG: hypothetical protein M1818_002667 [Claussenomyces sp. TS43310]